MKPKATFESPEARIAYSVLRIPEAPPSRITHHVSRFTGAFTLIEVMIACGIFFMATFAILALVAGSLRNARTLQKVGGGVDAGMAAAMVFDMMKTNRQEQGTGHIDMGDYYSDYEWGPYDTNGLIEVNLALYRNGNHKPVDSLSILVYDSNVQTGPGSRGFFPPAR